jgi:hypothetical protein
MSTRFWSLFLLTLGCAARSPSGSAVKAQLAEQDLCFGGEPEELPTRVNFEGPPDGHNPLAPHFQIMDGQLVWASPVRQWDVGRLDLATLKESWVRMNKPMIFAGASHGEVFGVVRDHDTTTGNEIFAVNLSTGAERSLLQGGSIWAESLRASTYVVEGDDLYFLRGPFAGSGRKGATLVRLQNRKGEPQALGHEPDSTYALFRIHDGFVYWNRSLGEDKFQLSRKALSPEAPVSKLAETHRRHVALTVSAGRIYYLDDGALQSVPLDGSAPPTRHADSPGVETSQLLIDRGCAYWTSERGLYRMRLHGPAAPEMIVSHTKFGGEHILTDGKHLYWHDVNTLKFNRLVRSERALSAEGTMVARPMVLKSPPADSADEYSTLALGDGWGCARVVGWGQKHWQCWQAPGTGGPPQGHTVPWLAASDLSTGPGQMCFLSASADLCWPWPGFAQSKPTNLPDPQKQILTGRDGQLLTGGTFACTIQYIGAERMLHCSGDNSFGQLAQADQPVMLEPWLGGAGTWHGCVARYGDVYCWGRGDGGQLGHEPADHCPSGNGDIACDRHLRRVDFSLAEPRHLFAGDMFTCALSSYPPRLVCWGANRDGWFGSTPCAQILRERWPTLTGAVNAPQATCSKIPVEVTGLDVSGLGIPGRSISVGPRGLCLVSKGRTHCLGAIPSPTVEVTRVKVSPGSHASACGIAGGKILCWGEDYSRADQPNQPVEIAMAGTQPQSAVVTFPPPAGQEWPQDKLIHKGFGAPPVQIPPCEPGLGGEPWSSLLPKAASLREKPIVVRDRLLVGPAHGRALRWIVLGEGDRALRLKAPYTNPGCAGDESLLACSLPAFGQKVVAQGKLVGSADNGWGLWDAKLCEAR